VHRIPAKLGRMKVLRLVLPLACATVLGAQAAPADSTRRPSPAFGAPEVRGFALTFAAGGLAYFADQAMRDAVRASGPQGSAALETVAGYGNPYGSPGVMALSAVLYGGGLLTKRPVIAASGLRGLESIAVSGLVTAAIKGMAGRERPEISPHDPARFTWLDGIREGGDFQALPSGHATAAFAFATAVHLEVRRRAPTHARWVGIVAYGSALASAYGRLHDDRHWLSDVVTGAGIGSVTAAAIHRWHATRPTDPVDGFLLKPVLASRRDGIGVGFSAAFR
jgi:membrane-associated phospholipid phosphatase